MRAPLAGTVTLVAAGSEPASAQLSRKVSDPTGTPLNGRTEPTERIIDALHNGVTVRQGYADAHDRDRSWARVVPSEGGKTGCLFREFVSCEYASLAGLKPP